MADTGKLVLKRYGNRRLYDTASSKYVTLGWIAEMIKQGFEVEVVDSQTKEDVTAYILTQIVLELARKKHALLPPALLHLIIRYGENVLQDFFEKYLHQVIGSYIRFKKAADEQFGNWIDMQMNYSDIARKMLSGLPSLFGKIPNPKTGDEK